MSSIPDLELNRIQEEFCCRKTGPGICTPMTYLITDSCFLLFNGPDYDIRKLEMEVGIFYE